MIRVILPTDLAGLARTGREVVVELRGPAAVGAVLDELEARYPMLRGTVRDQRTQERRAFIRFFACGEDISLQPAGALLPEAVASGREPLRIVAAMAGG